jgi:membrane associated rhomboid family serine protease
MLLWLVVCMTGTVGPIANAAHVGGLVMGGLWGLIPWLRRRILGHW